MKYTLFTVLATAFTSFANAYTTPVGDPQGNPIYKPGLNEIVPVGSPYTITWDPTTSGTVTLVLLRGPSTNVVPLYAIVEKVANTGTYSWTPASDLEDDVSHYGIQLIDDATGHYQYTTQFGISNSAPVPSPSPSPSPPPHPSSHSSPPPSMSLYSASPSSSYPPSVAPIYSVPTSSCTPVSLAAPSGGYPHGGLVTSGTVVYSTSLITVTSCGPAVTNCPGKPQTPTALPKPSVWTSAWNTTVSKYVAPTGYAPAVPSANVTKSPVPVVPVSPGAGDKIRVGGVMVVVMVAGLALVL